MYGARFIILLLTSLVSVRSLLPTIQSYVVQGTGTNPEVIPLSGGGYAIVHLNVDGKIQFFNSDGTSQNAVITFGGEYWHSSFEISPDVVWISKQLDSGGGNMDLKSFKCFVSNNSCSDIGYPYADLSGLQNAPDINKFKNQNAYILAYDANMVLYAQFLDEDLNDIDGIQTLTGAQTYFAIPTVVVFPSDRFAIIYNSATDGTNVLIMESDWSTVANFSLAGFFSQHHSAILLHTGDMLITRNYIHESGDQYQVRLDKMDSDGNILESLRIDVGGASLDITTFCAQLSEEYILVTWRTTTNLNQGAVVTLDLDYIGEFKVMRDEDATGNYGRGALLTDGTFVYTYFTDSSDMITSLIQFEQALCADSDDCPTHAPVCDQTLGECTIEPTIDISVDTSTVCPDDVLSLNISTNSRVESHFLSVTSNSSDSSAFEDFENHVNGETWKGILTIPNNLIELDVEYTFTLNVIAETEQASFQVQGLQELLALDASADEISTTPEEELNILIGYQECFGADVTLDVNQNSGIDIDLAPYFISQNEIDVPACTFFYEQEYEYIVQISYDDAPWIETEGIILIQGQPLSIEIQGESAIKSNEDLELSAPDEVDCFDSIKYKWTCELSRPSESALIDCPNQDSQFNTYSSSLASITLTPDNYDPEDTLTIELYIKYGEAETSIQKEIFVSSYVELSLVDPETTCSIKLGAQFDEIENAYNYEFTWDELSSNSQFNSLRTFLHTQSRPNIIIPSDYISSSTEYEFEVSYINFMGNRLTDTFQVTTSGFPLVNIEGGTTQNWVTFSEQTLRAQIQCLLLGGSSEWIQLSGPSLDLSDQLVPTRLHFQECSLQADEDYEFRYTLTIDEQSESIDVEVATLPQKFRVDIAGGSRVQKDTEDLELEALIITEGYCPFTNLDELIFKWECYLAESPISTFDECDDPDDLFGVWRTESHLTIPNSYFEIHNILQMTIIVGYSSQEYESTSTISIKDDNVFQVQLTCDSDLSCFVFSPQKEYQFSVEYSYEGQSRVDSFWAIEPYLETVQFINKLKTIPIDRIFDRSSTQLSSLLLDFNVRNSTHRSSVQMAIPINFAPHSGTITLTPTSGRPLSQLFIFDAPSWTDDEIPLSYRYSYLYSGRPRWLQKPFQAKSLSSEYKTIIPSNSSAGVEYELVIIVDIIDPYEGYNQANSTITILQQELENSEMISQIRQILDSILNYQDLQQKADQMNIITTSINQNEKSIVDKGKIAGGVCSCSGNGECDGNNNCECFAGFKSKYCELTVEEFDQIMEYKRDILGELNELILTTDSNETIARIISDLTESKNLNDDEIMAEGKELIDKLIDLKNDSTIISPKLANSTADIVGDMLKYSGENDCGLDGDFTKGLNEDFELYLEKIIEGALSDKITNENAAIYEEEQYSLFARKVTECTISQENYILGDDTPILKLNQLNILEDSNCTKEVILKFFAFNDQVFDCSKDGSVDPTIQKPLIILQILDGETGEDISEDYSVTILNPQGSLDECQSGCVEVEYAAKDQDFGLQCSCGSGSSIFDIGGQISRVFSQSNLGRIDSINALILHDLPQFWMAFSFTVLTIGLQIAIVKIKPNYCLMEKINSGGQISTLKTFLALFVYNHPLLNIPFLKGIEPSKTARLWIFFCRMNMMFAVVSIFGNQSSVEFGGRLLEGLDLSVDVYLLIIPFCTFIPLTALLVKLLAVGQKKNQRRLGDGTQDQIKQRKLIKCFRFIWYFGLFLMIIITLASLYAIISIASNSSYSENMTIMGFFGRTIAQDWLLTPIIMLIITIFVSEALVVKILSKSQPETLNPNPNFKKNQVVPLDIKQHQTLITETNLLLLPSPNEKKVDTLILNQLSSADEGEQNKNSRNQIEKDLLSISNQEKSELISKSQLAQEKHSINEQDLGNKNEDQVVELNENNPTLNNGNKDVVQEDVQFGVEFQTKITKQKIKLIDWYQDKIKLSETQS